MSNPIYLSSQEAALRILDGNLADINLWLAEQETRIKDLADIPSAVTIINPVWAQKIRDVNKIIMKKLEENSKDSVFQTLTDMRKKIVAWLLTLHAIPKNPADKWWSDIAEKKLVEIDHLYSTLLIHLFVIYQREIFRHIEDHPLIAFELQSNNFMQTLKKIARYIAYHVKASGCLICHIEKGFKDIRLHEYLLSRRNTLSDVIKGPLSQLKKLYKLLQHGVVDFQIKQAELLTWEEKKLLLQQLSFCTVHQSQAEDTYTGLLLNKGLSQINEKLEKMQKKPSCFISFAWHQEKPCKPWLLKFSIVLLHHLKKVGIEAKVDILSTRNGEPFVDMIKAVLQADILFLIDSHLQADQKTMKDKFRALLSNQQSKAFEYILSIPLCSQMDNSFDKQSKHYLEILYDLILNCLQLQDVSWYKQIWKEIYESYSPLNAEKQATQQEVEKKFKPINERRNLTPVATLNSQEESVYQIFENISYPASLATRLFSYFPPTELIASCPLVNRNWYTISHHSDLTFCRIKGVSSYLEANDPLIQELRLCTEKFKTDLEDLNNEKMKKLVEGVYIRWKESLERFTRHLFQKPTSIEDSFWLELDLTSRYLRTARSQIEQLAETLDLRDRAIALLYRIPFSYLAIEKKLFFRGKLALSGYYGFSHYEEQRLLSTQKEKIKLLLKETISEDFMAPKNTYIFYKGLEEYSFVKNLEEHLRWGGINATSHTLKDVKDSLNHLLRPSDSLLLVLSPSLIDEESSSPLTLIQSIFSFHKRNQNEYPKATLISTMLEGEFQSIIPFFSDQKEPILDWRNQGYLKNLGNIIGQLYHISKRDPFYQKWEALIGKIKANFIPVEMESLTAPYLDKSRYRKASAEQEVELQEAERETGTREELLVISSPSLNSKVKVQEDIPKLLHSFYKSCEARPEFTSINRWGGLFELRNSKQESVPLHELFSEKNQTKRICIEEKVEDIKRALIYHILHQWGRKRLWNNQTVFWIPLMKEKTKDKKYLSFYDHLHSTLDQEQQKQCTPDTLEKYIMDESDQVIFLIEEEEDYREKYKEFLDPFKIIFFSLSDVGKKYSTEPLKIILPEGKKELFLFNFFPNLKVKHWVMAFLSREPLKHLSHSPYFMQWICDNIAIELQEKGMRASRFNFSLSQFYEKLVLQVWRNFLKGQGESNTDYWLMSDIEKSEKYKPILEILEELAWISYTIRPKKLSASSSIIPPSLIFNEKELEKLSPGQRKMLDVLGFLEYKGNLFQFISRSFQAFFAARFIIRKNKDLPALKRELQEVWCYPDHALTWMFAFELSLEQADWSSIRDFFLEPLSRTTIGLQQLPLRMSFFNTICKQPRSPFPTENTKRYLERGCKILLDNSHFWKPLKKHLLIWLSHNPHVFQDIFLPILVEAAKNALTLLEAAKNALTLSQTETILNIIQEIDKNLPFAFHFADGLKKTVAEIFLNIKELKLSAFKTYLKMEMNLTEEWIEKGLVIEGAIEELIDIFYQLEEFSRQQLMWTLLNSSKINSSKKRKQIRDAFSHFIEVDTKVSLEVLIRTCGVGVLSGRKMALSILSMYYDCEKWGKSVNQEIKKTLKDALDSENSEIRAKTVLSWENISTKNHLENKRGIIRQALKDLSEEVKGAGLQLFRKSYFHYPLLLDESLLPLLNALSKDENEEIQDNALSTLILINPADEEVGNKIIQSFQQEEQQEEKDRRNLMHWLGNLGIFSLEKELLWNYLASGLEAEEEKIRKTAVRAIAKLGQTYPIRVKNHLSPFLKADSLKMLESLKVIQILKLVCANELIHLLQDTASNQKLFVELLETLSSFLSIKDINKDINIEKIEEGALFLQQKIKSEKNSRIEMLRLLHLFSQNFQNPKVIKAWTASLYQTIKEKEIEAVSFITGKEGIEIQKELLSFFSNCQNIEHKKQLAEAIGKFNVSQLPNLPSTLDAIWEVIHEFYLSTPLMDLKDKFEKNKSFYDMIVLMAKCMIQGYNMEWIEPNLIIYEGQNKHVLSLALAKSLFLDRQYQATVLFECIDQLYLTLKNFPSLQLQASYSSTDLVLAAIPNSPITNPQQHPQELLRVCKRILETLFQDELSFIFDDAGLHIKCEWKNPVLMLELLKSLKVTLKKTNWCILL